MDFVPRVRLKQTSPTSVLRNLRLERTYLALCLVLFVGSSSAASLTESLIQCSPSFSRSLYEHRTELGKVAKVEQDEKQHAWIPVPNRSDTSKSTAIFSKSIHDNSLALSGFYDNYFDLGAQGAYYFWGFQVDDSREAVMAATPEAGWKRSGEYYISNPRIKLTHDGGWQPNASAASEIAPAPGSAEKLVMLSQENGKTLLLCSIQGGIDNTLLRQERPDLAEKSAQ